jgi:Glycine zipper
MKRPVILIFCSFCLLFGATAFAQAPPPPPQSITLPIGTEIAIRTVDRINSKTADFKREYAASLDDAVIVDGVTVIPANTNAILRVVDKSRALLSISLIAVTINGQRVEVITDKVDSRRGSTVKRTAIGAGAGAGAGAAIGAIAGGGAGAGIGAAVGAATGGIFGHMTAKPVEIAPETRFTYTLTQPVVINSQ